MGEPAFYLGLPPRKLAELFAAIYALFLGVWGLMAWQDGVAIFWWAERSARLSGVLSGALVVFAIIHALGVRINGAWQWSPIMRLFGMSGHFGIILWLSAESFLGRWTAATPNYTAWAVLFFIGWLAALRDAIRAMEGRRQVWSL